MTFYNGRVYVADSPTGPFLAQKSNLNFLANEDGGGSLFPRLWGELYTGSKNDCLMTHQQCCDRGNPCYAGLVKRAILGDDGILRAGWLSENDVLKSELLKQSPVPSSWPRSPASNFSKFVTECTGDCMGSGLWIEGTLMVPSVPAQAVGVWLETVVGTTTTGFYFLIDGAGRFKLQGGSGEAQGSGKTIDRGMGALFKPNSTVPFRLLARNSWSGQGLTEHYVGDVLSLTQTLRGHLTGAFTPFGGSVNITAVHRLSLAEAAGHSENKIFGKDIDVLS